MPLPEAREVLTLDLEIKNILLVDDDVELANTLKALLESRNFVVTTVGDGVHALREVMAFDFDVIVCDLLMPNMPGDMFYLAVQKTKPELCRRFLFVTGHGDDPKVEDVLEAGGRAGALQARAHGGTDPDDLAGAPARPAPTPSSGRRPLGDGLGSRDAY